MIPDALVESITTETQRNMGHKYVTSPERMSVEVKYFPICGIEHTLVKEMISVTYKQ